MSSSSGQAVRHSALGEGSRSASGCGSSYTRASRAGNASTPSMLPRSTLPAVSARQTPSKSRRIGVSTSVEQSDRKSAPRGTRSVQLGPEARHARKPSHDSIAAESVTSMDDWDDSGFGVDHEESFHSSLHSPRHIHLCKEDGSKALIATRQPEVEATSPRTPQHAETQSEQPAEALGKSQHTSGITDAASCDVLAMLQCSDIIRARTAPTNVHGNSHSGIRSCTPPLMVPQHLNTAAESATKAWNGMHKVTATAHAIRATGTTQKSSTPNTTKPRQRQAPGACAVTGMAASKRMVQTMNTAAAQTHARAGACHGCLAASSQASSSMASMVYDPVLDCLFHASSDIEVPQQYYVLQ